VFCFVPFVILPFSVGQSLRCDTAKDIEGISAKIGVSMATSTRNSNGNSSLALAMTMLIQNQAIFVSHLDEDRRRFSRIESELEQIKTLILQYGEILKNQGQVLTEAIRNLPEAIRQKIGFKKS
jgi:hypothetical protein